MASFARPNSSSLGNATDAQLIAEYERIRQRHRQWQDQWCKQLSKSDLHCGARKLGMLVEGTLVFDCEAEISVLMDYCLRFVSSGGETVIERSIREKWDALDEEDRDDLVRQRDATYTLLLVEGLRPGVGCIVRDLLSDETHLLCDINLSRSANRDDLFAGCILRFPDFITSTGAMLGIGSISESNRAQAIPGLMQVAKSASKDPIDLIRRLLRRGAGQSVRYGETGALGEDETSVEMFHSTESSPAARKRLLASALGLPKGTQRCRCGSGKMFKNCCGKAPRA